MAIKDMSDWPDDKVPDWVLRHRESQREAPRLERERVERLKKIYEESK